jgi:hypothetical protein
MLPLELGDKVSVTVIVFFFNVRLTIHHEWYV